MTALTCSNVTVGSGGDSVDGDVGCGGGDGGDKGGGGDGVCDEVEEGGEGGGDDGGGVDGGGVKGGRIGYGSLECNGRCGRCFAAAARPCIAEDGPVAPRDNGRELLEEAFALVANAPLVTLDGGAAACGAFDCPRAAAAARISVVACGGAGVRKADSNAHRTSFLLRKHAQNDAFRHPKVGLSYPLK
jgi:hypothetical protein